MTLHTLDFVPILAVACLFFKASSSVSPRPVLTGLDMAYVGSSVTFWCSAPDSPPPITHQLLRDGHGPIGTHTVTQGNQPVPFLLKVTAALEGSYHCKATTGGGTGVSDSIQLSVVTPPASTRVFSEPFPPVVYEGSPFVLSCNTARGSHLSYTWFFNRKELSSSSSFSQASGNKLIMEEVTPEHAGFYSCMAWSRVQNTRRFSSSPEVRLVIKVYTSTPSMSFSIAKEGSGYHGNVTCWCSRGTPPVNFSLTIDDREVGSFTATDSLTAWFAVAMAPGLDLGTARCRVTNEVQNLTSEPVSLVVVPVGGAAMVEVDYLYGADSRPAAARLRCGVSRGTFPHVSWLLNASVLPAETNPDSHIRPLLRNYALADSGRTLFLTSLGPEESGFYRCRARDRYDDSGSWLESKAILVQVTDKAPSSPPAAASPPDHQPKVTMTTVKSMTIIFCCLCLLALALSFGYMHKMCLQARGHSA